MQRRGFLGTAAVGTTAMAGLATSSIGCGAAMPHQLADDETHRLLARLARGREALASEPFGTLAADRFVRPDLTEHVLRLSMESLLVLDVLRSIPEGVAVPEPVVEALGPHLPRLDRSVHTHRALLARMPAQKRRELDARARRDPEIGMDVAAWIDDQAARLGVPHDNRLRLRHSAVTVKTRLRRQSTSALIDDCTRRLDEVLTADGTPLPTELAAHTNAVVDAMWRDPAPVASSSSKGFAEDAAEDHRALAGDRASYVVPSRFGSEREMAEPTEPVQWNASWARPGDEERRLGAILMPLGFVSCGLLTIAGLIVFVTGETQNGNWDGRSHASDWSLGD